MSLSKGQYKDRSLKPISTFGEERHDKRLAVERLVNALASCYNTRPRSTSARWRAPVLFLEVDRHARHAHLQVRLPMLSHQAQPSQYIVDRSFAVNHQPRTHAITRETNSTDDGGDERLVHLPGYARRTRCRRREWLARASRGGLERSYERCNRTSSPAKEGPLWVRSNKQADRSRKKKKTKTKQKVIRSWPWLLYGNAEAVGFACLRDRCS